MSYFDKHRQLRLSFDDTAHMVAESIEYLKRYEPEEGYYVGDSGGKDSTVTLTLCEMAGVKFQPYYSCTRIDPTEAVRFIKKHHTRTIFLYPKTTIYQGIKDKMPPLIKFRWCCDELKKYPSIDIPLNIRVMGIRAEESNKRAIKPREQKWRKQLEIKPIFYWSEYHVWDFIEAHQIPYCELYDQGFDRIGCVVCPFMFGKSNNSIIKRSISQNRWPGIWKAFEHACKVWFESKRMEELRPGQKHDNFTDYYKAYLNGFE